MDRGAWQAIVHGVVKNQTQLSTFIFSDRLMRLTWHTEEQREQECNSSEGNEEERYIRISVRFITEKENLKIKQYADSDGKLEKNNLI